MLLERLIIAPCALAMSAGLLVAQVATENIGGPEGLDIYEELTSGEGEEGSAEGASIWDVNDSLTFIPGYDMYCHWNTDVLFNQLGVAGHLEHDTLKVVLGEHECDLTMPCDGRMTSPYGMRRGRMHYGVDLDLETGDAVLAAFPGMVRISKYNKTFGHVVVVRHFNGLETLYAHLSKRSVEPGTLVEAGDTLGLGGNTGRSYGSHLHFEVRFLDQPIDPALVFDLENGSLRALEFDIHKGTFAKMAAAKVEAQKSQASRKYHVIRRGDTLYALSRRYGVKVKDLCRINGISERSTLAIGQRIRYN
ncbi:MAG: peptidoglycan DD-metalloendopeptidase family protein [Flavobacteriales bacterium]|nr:peptidoglycan DD-metalloendopeptidase family protein [Flavobacteriales bacterium]